MTSSKKYVESEEDPPMLNPSTGGSYLIVAQKADAMAQAARVYLISNGDPQAMVRHLEQLEQQKAKADKKTEIEIEEVQ